MRSNKGDILLQKIVNWLLNTCASEEYLRNLNRCIALGLEAMEKESK